MDLLVEDVSRFLRQAPPFSFLDDDTLASVAGSLSMEYYPAGTTILRQGGQPSTALRLIKKGGVKITVSSDGGDETLIDYRGDGDNFGFLSLIGKDAQDTTITSVEDTICYLLPKDRVLKLLESNPAFTEYFLKKHLSKYIHRASVDNGRLHGAGGRGAALYTTQVSDVMNSSVITVRTGSSIREAARKMAAGRVGSVVVVGADGAAIGIVTDEDLRSKVVAEGRSYDADVTTIMSSPLVSVDARRYCFDVLLTMLGRGIHHVLVTDDGRIAGIVTNHDLLFQQGVSPLVLARNIASQEAVDGLADMARKISDIVGLLLKEGARAAIIMRIVTELNDHVLRRAVYLAGKRFGAAPVPYCWLALGSEGRCEQVYASDQDNAVVYQQPLTDDEEEIAWRYFSPFTVEVQDILERCGFPPCEQGFMASNPLWCQPPVTWNRHFTRWLAEPRFESLATAQIFYDMRPVAGDSALSADVRRHALAQVDNYKIFLGSLANQVTKNRPPLGFFKSFVVEKSGEHRDELNLKVKGSLPIVDIMRFFALEKGIDATSTLERIAQLRDSHATVMRFGDELDQSFEFIMLLRIINQHRQHEAGLAITDFINPDQLTSVEKKGLKDAFETTSRVLDTIVERYRLFIC